MDRNIIIIFTCFFLLFFFTFSSARTPFNSNNDINVDDILIDIPFSLNNIINNNPIDHDDNSILLPTQKLQPEEKTTHFKMETPMPKTETDQPLPLTDYPLPFTVFLPRRPSRLSNRPVHHRCHHHNHHYRPWNDRHFPRRGGDSVEDKDFDPVARGGSTRIPAEPMFSRERSNKIALEKREFLRRLYERYHKDRQEQQLEPENKDTGLVKKIRKFLNRF